MRTAMSCLFGCSSTQQKGCYYQLSLIQNNGHAQKSLYQMYGVAAGRSVCRRTIDYDMLQKAFQGLGDNCDCTRLGSEGN